MPNFGQEMSSPKKPAPAVYKVVLIGESSVGKSSMFIRFRTGIFEERIKSTVGLDHTERKVTFTKQDGKTGAVQIQLWDTAGLERTGRMTNTYYNNSRAVILMYDVTNASALNNLQLWYEDSNLYCREEQGGVKTLYFLVGNKIDSSSSDIEVREQAASGFAQRFGLPEEHVFRISVKTGKGLDKFLNTIALILSETSEPVKQKNVIIDESDEHDKNCAC